MSKTISALEKEVGLWRARYEKANRTLIETTEEVRKRREILRRGGMSGMLGDGGGEQGRSGV